MTGCLAWPPGYGLGGSGSRRNSAVLGLALGLASLLVGCEGAPPASSARDVLSVDEVTFPPSGEVSVDDDGVRPEGAFELGVNETGRNTPEYYAPLPDGAELLVEFGPQGLWMVVLAFRTHDLFTPPLFLRSRVVLEGELLGELVLAEQVLQMGGDGWDYYYNLFLVVGVETMDVDGQPATLDVVVQDAAGHEVSMRRAVILVGGP